MTKRPLVLLALMVVLLDFGLISFGIIHPKEYYHEGDTVTIRGRLYSKQQKDGYNQFYLKDAYDHEKKIGRVILYEYFDKNTHKGSYEIPISAEVEVAVKVLAMRRAENEGGFDERSYLISRGIFTKGELCDIRVLGMPYFSVSNYLFNLRERMVGVYSVILPGEESGILSNLTLGDKSSMSSEAKDLFSEAGLSHIFAISAMHISIVGMGIFSILNQMLNRKLTILISTVFVVMYGVMVGGSVSALRAVGMFIIMLFAMVVEEAYDTLSALSLMAVIILIRNPFSLFDVSFIFSFGVVLCLILLANPIAGYYTEYCRVSWEKGHRMDHGRRFRIRFHQRIIRELLRGATIQIASLPLVAFFYFSIPAYVILLNMILLPFLGVLLGCGLVGGVAGLVCMPMASLVLKPCHFLIYLYEFMADASLRLPFSRLVVGRPHMWQIVIYYIVLLVVSFCVCQRLDDLKRESGRYAKGAEDWGRVMIGVLICFGMVLIVVNLRFNRFEIAMLSVGQGDGIFIDSGMGEKFFVDGGSTSNEEVGKYVMKPFLNSRGVDRIDGWFLSHMDLDHISGFVELVESGFEVETLYLAKGIEPGEQLEEIKSLCKKYNIDIRYMLPHDMVCCSRNGFGLSKARRLEIECLAPDYPSQFSGPNENSEVLWLRYDDGSGSVFDCIFTGDIGEEQEKGLVGNLDDSLDGGGRKVVMDDDFAGGNRKVTGEDGFTGGNRKVTGEDGSDIEVLKSAHHGSNSSNCSEWLSFVSPRLCIISAGKNNRYGHPGKEAIARMDELGISHLCTIDAGQITVRWEDGKMSVERFVH